MTDYTPSPILSAAERASQLALPNTEDELIWHYTFSETDLSLIRQRRGDANRLGVAVQGWLGHSMIMEKTRGHDLYNPNLNW